jgi:CheY-like chemotaxis protein
MKTNELTAPDISLNILYADKNIEDHFFFAKILNSLPFRMQLTIVENGVDLMEYLSSHLNKLPDVLFLDCYNLRGKNGAECLSEIKQNPELRQLPVIIYSSYLNEEVLDGLFKSGADYYIGKSGLAGLKPRLQYVFEFILENKPSTPIKSQYVM